MPQDIQALMRNQSFEQRTKDQAVGKIYDELYRDKALTSGEGLAQQKLSLSKLHYDLSKAKNEKDIAMIEERIKMMKPQSEYVREQINLLKQNIIDKKQTQTDKVNVDIGLDKPVSMAPKDAANYMLNSLEKERTATKENREANSKKLADATKAMRNILGDYGGGQELEVGTGALSFFKAPAYKKMANDAVAGNRKAVNDLREYHEERWKVVAPEGRVSKKHWKGHPEEAAILTELEATPKDEWLVFFDKTNGVTLKMSNIHREDGSVDPDLMEVEVK